MRLLSSIRCNRSPINFVSKNLIGNFINLIKKSERSEILIRVEICKSIFERMKSIAMRLKSNTISAIRISQTKLISLPPIPISTIAWVRNGKINCSREPRINPSISCKKNVYKILYVSIKK